MIDKIRIEIDKPGQGKESHEFEYCPLSGNDNICRIHRCECKYGLTEIVIPTPCSMKNGTITIKFKAIDATDF